MQRFSKSLLVADACRKFSQQNAPKNEIVTPIRRSVGNAMSLYEEFLGVKAVRIAQSDVMECEDELSKAQLARRQKQAEIKSVQARLKEIHLDLDRTSRGEDRYLHLLTEEHAIIKKERALLESFEALETDEREAFYQLSNRVRLSHERERERAEKTKWWGVSASLLGALLGIAGTSIGNELRMRRLREMLPVGGAQMSEMAKVIREQNTTVEHFMDEIKSAFKLESGAEAVKGNDKTITVDTENFDKAMSAIREENARLSSQMAELSRLAKLEAALGADPNAVVYVGNDMERLLDKTERQLESKMKLQTLVSVVFLYAAVGVTVPLIFAFLRGN